jgi:hypothetical protein
MYYILLVFRRTDSTTLNVSVKKHWNFYFVLGYRVLLGIIPKETERIVQMMVDLGLNPDDNHEDEYTPIGIGNLCGNNVVADRNNDGANQVF